MTNLGVVDLKIFLNDSLEQTTIELSMTYLSAVDLGAIFHDISDGFVSRSADGVLGSRDGVDDGIEDEHAANGHLIGGQGAGLVGADDRSASKSFDGGERSGKRRRLVRQTCGKQTSDWWSGCRSC